MTPDQLLTFAVVAETGAIGRAAEVLHLTQPAVSGQLRLLQSAFGQPLYRREGRGIRLTPAGEQLAGIARQLRQTYERAHTLRAAIAGLRGGSLAIGASTTPASYLLPYIVAEFRVRHPGVTLTLASGNTSLIVGDLQRFDFAFIEGAVPTQLPVDTVVRPWVSDEIVALVRDDHPLAGRRRTQVTLAELAPHPLVMREAGSGVRQQVAAAFAAAGLAMQVGLELAGVEGVREAVRAGLGVGFVSAMAVPRGESALVALRLSPVPLARNIAALIPHGDALGAPARAFWDICSTHSRIQSEP
ncbi:LysR family transcriptional regulator [Verticiella sediminum]|uniref:LysR family transcriptional regulator n=1 Tax=Verticiella sediminum TaxID=1247510 RepID=A0A556A7M7_9BURK|nr:LysR family transcriptional regulator [Verticiella sediminum]TSH88870.1 LysR family transcriptional regulator [Verticiella sediminum]